MIDKRVLQLVAKWRVVSTSFNRWGTSGHVGGEISRLVPVAD